MSQLDFAVIGNCQISALVDKNATYVWSCMPRFDSPSVFSSLLGGEAVGQWSCLPEQPFTSHQQYVKNTNVVQTFFQVENGDRFQVIDFAPRFYERCGFTRPTQLIRILRPIHGSPVVKMTLNPKYGYGNETAQVHSTEGEGLVYEFPTGKFFLQTNIPTSYLLENKPFALDTEYYCVFSYGEPFQKPLKYCCEEYLERTVDYWKRWTQHCSIPFEFQDAVIRSALALKLHIYEDTGAIIAATTTSLPESPDGGRCWDYRYCWLRDAYFVISALGELGHFEEMERFIQYLQNLSNESGEFTLQPVYGIGGERELHERDLPWLKGFKGIGPVRVGNAAYTHSQFDVYGEMVLAKTRLFFDSRLERNDLKRTFESVVRLVEKSISVFDERDSGIWEFRSEMQHYLFSKLLCWSAVEKGLKIAQHLGKEELYARWKEAEQRMRKTIEKEGWDPVQGIYTQTYGRKSADASNLLMRSLNFHDAKDERFVKMVTRYKDLLMQNGYVFRYRNPDDFGTPIHAFTICTFWMISALAAIGQKEEARTIFEKVLSCRNHVGLLSEDIDPLTGELWGNFPQTYSHVGLIHSAFQLSKSWEKAF